MQPQKGSLIHNIATYHVWANNQLRHALETTSPELFEKDLGDLVVNDTDFTVPSVRSLVEHSMMGFYYTHAQMENRHFDSTIIIQRLHDFNQEQLIQEWKKLDADYLLAFERSLNTKVTIEGKEQLLDEDYFFIFFNHSIHHRGQIMMALRLAGGKGVDTDYYSFLHQNE